MKQFISLTFLVLVISLAGVEVFAQRVGIPAITQIAERQSGDEFTFSAKTPKGANVYGVRPPSAGMLNAIDNGLDDLFAIARRYNYRSRLNHSFYSIYIARPDRQKDRGGNYSPAFAVNVPSYAGSQYDQGGFIYAAGMVFYLNPDSFLIVDYGTDFKSVSDIVRYEGEHIILYYNDRRLYNQTANHSQSSGHPILR